MPSHEPKPRANLPMRETSWGCADEERCPLERTTAPDSPQIQVRWPALDFIAEEQEQRQGAQSKRCNAPFTLAEGSVRTGWSQTGIGQGFVTPRSSLIRGES